MVNFSRILFLNFCIIFLLIFNFYGCSNKVYTASRNYQNDFKIQKIGVFPFTNESRKWRGDDVVTNIFIAELFKSGIFIVEEKGTVEQFLTREKVNNIKQFDVELLKKIGEKLGIDAVIVGTVEKLDGGDVGNRLPTPVVAIRARLIDVKNGRILWMGRHEKNGDDYITVFSFGKVRSVGALLKRVVAEIVKTIQINKNEVSLN